MATVYKRAKSSVWYARVKIWSEVQNKWVWKALSTGVTDQEEAKVLADEMEKVSRMGKSMTSKTMDLDRFKHLIESILATAGVRVEKGEDWPSIQDYVKAYMEKIKGKVTENTLRTYVTIQNDFYAWLNDQEAENARMDWFTPSRADTYYSFALSKVSPKSAKERIKFVSRIYDDAVKLKGYPVNPCDAVTLIKNNGKSNKLERLPFTLKEVKTMLTHLGGLETEEAKDWKRAIYLALMSGCRLGDAVTMTSDNIGDGAIEYVQAKTHKSIKCPMVVEEWRDEIEAIEGSICPTLHENYLTRKNAHLSSQFTKIVTDSGIKQSYQQFESSGRKVARKTFHSLRHTLRSSIVASGGSDAQADLILGHSPGQGRQYTHSEEESMKQVLKLALGDA